MSGSLSTVRMPHALIRNLAVISPLGPLHRHRLCSSSNSAASTLVLASCDRMPVDAVFGVRPSTRVGAVRDRCRLCSRERGEGRNIHGDTGIGVSSAGSRRHRHTASTVVIPPGRAIAAPIRGARRRRSVRGSRASSPPVRGVRSTGSQVSVVSSSTIWASQERVLTHDLHHQNHLHQGGSVRC